MRPAKNRMDQSTVESHSPVSVNRNNPMPKLSPLSVIDPLAQLAADVEVGPFCVLGPKVRLGPGCRLLSHVTLLGNTTFGSGNIFFPNCVIGGAPQDLKYQGSDTQLIVGEANTFREGSTAHVGTEKGSGITRIGNRNLIMVNAHIGHDVEIGDECVISNNVMIAGHVVIGDRVVLSGGAGIHHFVTIGDFAYLGGYARIRHDVPPYIKVDGNDEIRGLNSIGLRRAGFSEVEVEALEDAIRDLFYRDKALAITMAEYEAADSMTPHVARVIQFLRRRAVARQGRHLETIHRGGRPNADQ